jgi:hypothetical protein
MDGFVEAVEELFSFPVSMARIRNTNTLHDISFACALGLARYSLERKSGNKSGNILFKDNFIGRALSRIESIFREYF